jgi:alkanesulfonate monooxygenase
MATDRLLRFHWSLSQAGNPFRRAVAVDTMPGLPDYAAQLELCLRAEECGIESMLMALGTSESVSRNSSSSAGQI